MAESEIIVAFVVRRPLRESLSERSKFMEDEKQNAPNDQQIPRTFQKWVGGVVVPALLVVYGIWVILPPHFRAGHIHDGRTVVWTIIVIVWGVMAIGAAGMCFPYYFFGGMTDWVWVEVLFVISSFILGIGGFGLLLLLCAAVVLGQMHRYR